MTVQTSSPNCAGKAGVQYYKVPMAFGDTLVMDSTNVTGSGTGLCLMDPTVTDYAVANARCLKEAYSPTSNKGQLRYVASGDGAYLLAITAGWSGSWAYQAIVNVLHPSSVALSGPSSVKVGRKIKLTGQLTPAAALPVVLQIKSGGWKTVETKTAGGTGAYKFVYRPQARGLYKFRVLFGGGNGYLASQSSKVKVRAN